MSFPKLTFFEKIMLQNLPKPHPRHIAFIMDGNRRYAKSKGQSVHKGHELGLSSLKKMLLYAL